MHTYTKFQADNAAQHAKRLANVILESPFLSEDRRKEGGKVLVFPFFFSYIEDKRTGDYLHAAEACYVALTHDEPLIAFRAYVAAQQNGYPVKDVLLSDALAVARDRVESAIVATFPEATE